MGSLNLGQTITHRPHGARVPDAGPSSAPQWRAFLELGFRPLYIAGGVWAAVSVVLWVYAPQFLTGVLSGVLWHAHEMLWGFIATIAVGFLLTAVSNWTGVNPLHGPALGGLGVLWLIARAGYLVPGRAAFCIAAGCELAFFGLAAAALGRAIYRTHNGRNVGVPPLVLALGVADALYLWAALRGDSALVLQRFGTGLLCMAVITLLIARRIIPFFAMRAVDGLSIPTHARSGKWQLGASVLAVVFSLLQWSFVTGVALAVAGVIAFVHVIAWKPLAVRHKPLLWILYIGYAALGAGLLVAAAQRMGWITRTVWPAHAIGVAGFSVLIIGMITRTALGHLGRFLRTDWSMVSSYVLMITAAVFRLVALFPTPLSRVALHAAAVAWVLAFGLYLWRFVPMLIRPSVARPALPMVQAERRP